MLKIHPHTSSSASKWYYTGNRHEYYSEEQESLGVWGGKGAERLGLIGQVSPDAFGALCDNLHPVMGDRLTARTKEHRRIGYDLTFSPPKSVSVVHALTQDARIVAAVQDAAHAAMRIVEKDAKTRVRTDGRDFDRPTGELTWAAFTHLTSRPVNGIPDPQLHVHCFTFNATFDKLEERWKAAQLGDIVKMGPYYQTLFHARLAANLEKLGYQLDRNEKSFEMVGISQDIIKQFSKRKQQIEDRAAKYNVTSKETRSMLAVITREAKRHDLTPEHMHEQWASRLTDEQRDFISKYRPQTSDFVAEFHNPELENRAIAYALARSFERESVVDERKFLEAAMRYGMGRLELDRLRERLAADPQLVRIERKGQFVITTGQVMAEENELVSWVKKGQATQLPLAPNAKLSQGLLAEQRQAALAVLKSRDRITAIMGRAGSGKTSLMHATIGAIRSTNVPVVVCAPNSDTAHETLHKAGFTDACTVRSLLDKAELYERARNGVIWVDEAGLLSIRDMLDLMKLAEKMGARLILSGDTRQHRSVERGDALRILEKHSEIEIATLDRTLRQQGTYRDAVDALAEGKLEEACRKLDEMGAIVELQGLERFEFIAKKYIELRDGPDSVHIVSPTHAEGRKVTEAVRNALKANGELKNERILPQLRRVDLHDADKQQASAYRKDWIVEMIKSAGGYKAGDRLEVLGVENGQLIVRDEDFASVALDIQNLSKRFQVYEQGHIEIAPGDRLRVSKNGLDPIRRRLVNSTLHTVAGFTSTGDIELDDGRIIPRNFGHIGHGYVTTSYAAQSKTVKYIIISLGVESFAAANRQQQYVSFSRGQIAPLLVTNDKEGLFETFNADSRRTPAIEILQPDLPLLTPIVPPRTRDQLGTLPRLHENPRIRLAPLHTLEVF